jgi:superfamily II DNA or RNA helicase
VELRPYQRDAVEAIAREHETNRSTLLVMATGLGKTRVFAEAIHRQPGRCLVLAHRDELVQQAKKRVEEIIGEYCGVEKAELYGQGERVIIGSVQTLTREGRLSRYRPNEFALVVGDEFHHAPAPSWRKVLDYFAGAKVLGVTATPDRTDRLAMGTVVDSVAYVYDIADGIRDGYLCPIKCRSVLVEGVDLSGVKTTAGDLNQGQLDELFGVERALHGIAKPLLLGGVEGHDGPLAGDRRTVVFSTSIATAILLTDVMNRYRPGCARVVHSEMDMDERRKNLRDYEDGVYQFVVNIGVLTEGWDSPQTSCIAIARPTKSRSLFTQMVGRGTRIHEAKQSGLLVIDFTGNAGRHKLVSPHDILAGRYDDDVVERAKRITADDPDIDILDALTRAEKQLNDARLAAEMAAMRKRLQANVRARVSTVDPFAVLGVSKDAQDRWGGQFGARVATDKQLAMLERSKVPIPDGLTAAQASALVGTIIQRRDKGLCTFAQAKTLRRYGFDTDTLSMARATALITAIAGNNWKPLPDFGRSVMAARIPGEDG